MKFRNIIPIIIIIIIACAILVYSNKYNEGFKVDVSDYLAQLAERNIIMSRNASFNRATAPSTQTGGEVLSTQAPAPNLSEYDPSIYAERNWDLECKQLGMKSESGILFTEDECLKQLGGDSWKSYSEYLQLPPLYNRVSIELGFCGRRGITLAEHCIQ